MQVLCKLFTQLKYNNRLVYCLSLFPLVWMTVLSSPPLSASSCWWSATRSCPLRVISSTLAVPKSWSLEQRYQRHMPNSFTVFIGNSTWKYMAIRFSFCCHRKVLWRFNWMLTKWFETMLASFPCNLGTRLAWTNHKATLSMAQWIVALWDVVHWLFMYLIHMFSSRLALWRTLFPPSLFPSWDSQRSLWAVPHRLPVDTAPTWGLHCSHR